MQHFRRADGRVIAFSDAEAQLLYEAMVAGGLCIPDVFDCLVGSFASDRFCAEEGSVQDDGFGLDPLSPELNTAEALYEFAGLVWLARLDLLLPPFATTLQENARNWTPTRLAAWRLRLDALAAHACVIRQARWPGVRPPQSAAERDAGLPRSAPWPVDLPAQLDRLALSGALRIWNADACDLAPADAGAALVRLIQGGCVAVSARDAPPRWVEHADGWDPSEG